MSKETDKLKRMVQIEEDSKSFLLDHVEKNEGEHSEFHRDIEILDNKIETIQLTPGKDGEIGERGNKFIGKFNSVEDLPDIDDINVKQGDWAYIDNTGEVWYA